MFASLLRATVAIVCALAATAPALADSTAKAALQEAVAASQKWQPDAVLTHVSTLNAKANGTARLWLYTMYSPKVKKSAIVTAQDKKVELEEVLRNTSVDPIGEFIDSDKAVEDAVKSGLQIDQGAQEVMMGLTVGNQAVGKPQLLWSVTLSTKDGFSGVTLNGKDGAFIKRDDVKLK